MRIGAHRAWRWGARAAAVAAAVLSAWVAVAAFNLSIGPWPTGSTLGVRVGVVLAVLPFALGFAALMPWLAWRLWFRWDAATARLAVGTAIGVGLLWATSAVLAAVERGLGRSGGPDDAVSSAVVLVDLIIGALAYRRSTRAVICWAELEDRRDVYGQPLGHAGRARAFCLMLGWAVWMTGSGVAHATGLVAPRSSGPGLVDGAAIFGPIVLGWGTYKVVLWRLSPRTRPAVPAGGFEVLPVTRSEGAVG